MISLYSSATFNTKDDLPYVRQKVEDLHTLELSTKYKFAKESYISLGAGAGYSFKIKNSVYSARLGVQYILSKHYSMILDCAYLYSENIYDSTQCNALMYYSW
jgi:outer membrane autotransporter protein